MNDTRKLDIEAEKVALERDKVELERAKIMAGFDKIDAEIVHMKADTIRLLADAESKEVGDQLAAYKLQLEALAADVESQRNSAADKKPDAAKPAPKKKTDQPVLTI